MAGLLRYGAWYRPKPPRKPRVKQSPGQLIQLGVALANNAEGATTGTALTAGNQGAGNDVLTITKTSGASTVQATATAGEVIHDTQSLKLVAAAAESVRLSWPSYVVSDGHIRAYFLLNSAPSVDNNMLTLQGTTGAIASAVVRTTGRVALTNANAGTSVAVSPIDTPLTFPCVIGLDLAVEPGSSTSNGTAKLDVYLGSSQTPWFSSGEITSDFFRTGTIVDFRLGVLNAQAWTIFVDSIVAGSGYTLSGPVASTALTETLADPFTGTTIDTGKWTASAGITQSDTLTIPCTNAYKSLQSVNTYSLIGSSVAVQVVQTAGPGTGTCETLLQLEYDSSNSFRIERVGNSYAFGSTTAGTDSITYNTWDPGLHKWWKISESGGTVSFQASSTGATWTTLGTISLPAWGSNPLTVSLKSGYYGTETSPPDAIFDNLNVAPSLPSTTAATIHTGVWAPDPEVSTATWQTNLNTFDTDSGKRPDLNVFYQGWSGTPAFPSSFCDIVYSRGQTPIITWEPWLYSAGTSQPTYSLANIIAGNFDSYITTWALAAQAYTKTVYLRFAHEMNGNWYPWAEGVNGNTSGQYAAAWQHVKDIFTANSVTNVKWVWCPNAPYSGSTSLTGLYPGTSYVDVTGLDGYCDTSGWKTFDQIFAGGFDQVRALDSTHPLWIIETGCVEAGGSKSVWITDMFTTMKYHTEVTGLAWWNDTKGADAYSIETTPGATSAYAAGVADPRYMSSAVSLAMAGTGTLTVTPTVTRTASVSMAGSGALTQTASQTVLASVPLTGTGALSVTVSRAVLPTVPMSGTGALSVTPSLTTLGTVPLTGTGTLAITAATSVVSPVSMSGAGTLSVSASQTVLATVPLTGTGSLAVTATVGISPTAVLLSGAGTLSLTAVVAQAATVPMVGTGTLALSATTSLSGILPMAGAGNLSVSPSFTRFAVVSMAGAGTSSITGTVTVFAAVPMAASGALSITAVLTHTATVPMAGTGALSVTVTHVVSISSFTFAGAGTLAITPTLVRTGIHGMSGTGTMDITPTTTVLAAVSMAGTGGFSVAATIIRTGVLTFSSTGTLNISVSQSVSAIVNMTGTSTFLTSGAQTFGGVLNLTGTSSFVISSVGGATAALVLIGSGTFTVTVSRIVLPTSLMTGTGSLTVLGVLIISGTVPMSGTGTCSVTATGGGTTTLQFSGSSTLGITALLTHSAVLTLFSTGSLVIVPLVGYQVSLALAGAGTLSITPTRVVPGVLALSSSGALSITTATVIRTGILALSGVGTLGVKITTLGVLAFTGQGTMAITVATAISMPVPMTGFGSLLISPKITIQTLILCFSTSTMQVTTTIGRTGSQIPFTGLGVMQIFTATGPQGAVLLVGFGTLIIVPDALDRPHHTITIGRPRRFPATIVDMHTGKISIKGPRSPLSVTGPR